MMPDQTTFQLNTGDRDIWVGSSNDEFVELTVDGPDEKKGRTARVVCLLSQEEANWLRDMIGKKMEEIKAYQSDENLNSNG